MSVYTYLIPFASAFLLSLALTPLVRKLALASGKVAVPRETRWHKKETALLGGVAVFVSTLAAWLLTPRFTNLNSLPLSYLPMILCASAIFLLGLADDIFNIDPQHKLAGQIVITSVLVFLGVNFDWTASKTLNLVLSIIWIVGITNAFNLLDNMDGLSAGIAFIAGVFVFLTRFLNGGASTQEGPVLLMTAAYLGSVLGFLIYNFNPASIFMGDAGSLFIGFVMACLTILAGTGTSTGGSIGHVLSVMAIPILIVFIPILDTGFVTLMRKLFSRPISQGGKDHSSHRMVAIGFSERRAVVVLYGFSAVSGLIALFVSRLTLGLALLLIVLYLLFVAFFWIYLGRVKVYAEESILTRKGPGVLTPVLVEVTYKRRLFEVLLDCVLISVAYYAAYLLRFEGNPGPNFDFFLKSLPIMLACQIFAFYVLGVYRGVWESTGVRDLVDYVKAITAGTVMTMLILLFAYRFYSFSRAVFVIYWGFMVILVSLSRLSFRILDEGFRLRNQKGEHTLIYGAGVGGQFALKEIENNHDLGLKLVGFVDDNPRLKGRKIKGYPIFGGKEALEAVIQKQGIKKIIVSFKDKGSQKVKDIKSLCLRMGAEVDVKQMRVEIS
jgi:UDP-GlcNAc:undecaprenyl-phosphate GlcNAc-1-phosphate transferase